MTRVGGKVKYASVQTTEKIPRAIELTARGPAGHGSVPLENNAIIHLSQAVAAVATWVPPVSLNETTARVLQAARDDLDAGGGGTLSRGAQPRPEGLRPGRRLLPEAGAVACVDDPHVDLADHDHRPGIASNVIPVRSEGHARRAHAARSRTRRAFLESVKKVINDPAVEVAWARPRHASQRGAGAARLRGRSRPSRRTSPSTTRRSRCRRMSTGATDMAYLRAKGMQCYGIGPALDREDGAEGLRRAQRPGAHPRDRVPALRPLLLRHRPGYRPRPSVGPSHARHEARRIERCLPCWPSPPCRVLRGRTERSLINDVSDNRQGRRGGRLPRHEGARSRTAGWKISTRRPSPSGSPRRMPSPIRSWRRCRCASISPSG